MRDGIDDIAKIYDRESGNSDYVAHLASIWGEARFGDLPLREFCRMLDRLHVPAYAGSLMVADLGCGTGRDLPLIRSGCHFPVQVIGCDISSGMLLRASESSEVVQLSIEDFLKDRASCFHGIWCHFSLIHLRGRDMLARHLQLIRNALCPGGVLGIGLKCGDGQSLDDPPDDTNRLARPTTYWRQADVEMLTEETGLQIKWVLAKPAKADPVPHRYTWFLGVRL
jgi:SAM-dependent methyltransferase